MTAKLSGWSQNITFRSVDDIVRWWLNVVCTWLSYCYVSCAEYVIYTFDLWRCQLPAELEEDASDSVARSKFPRQRLHGYNSSRTAET